MIFPGDPVADAFAICARENNCVMLIADGVNWGEKSRLAARSALYGSMVYINKRIFKRHRPPANTHVSTYVLHFKSENMLSNICKIQRFRSSCTLAKYPGLCTPFIHSVVSNVSVSGQ